MRSDMPHSNYILLDAMSLIHAFTYKIENLPLKSQGRAIKDWIGYFGRPHLYTPKENPISMGIDDVLPVLCIDLKDTKHQYWRHTYHPKYKTGRKEKTPTLIGVRDQVYEAWKGLGLPYLEQPGFEADDWAGAWVRSMPDTERVGLVSVDGDWSQLVSERVMWMDTFPPSGRSNPTQKESVLGVEGVLNRFNNQRAFKGHPLKKPHDIVDHKHLFGDDPDKIPKGRLVPIGIIDLLNPLITPDMGQVHAVRGADWGTLNLPPVSSNPHFMYGVPDWKYGTDS